MRDFFYNKGDVLVAILIIAVAAFVIYFRVGVIMDYSVSEGEGDGLLPLPSFFQDEEGDVQGQAGNDLDSVTSQTETVPVEPSPSDTGNTVMPEGEAPVVQAPPETVVQDPAAVTTPTETTIVVAANSVWEHAEDSLIAAGAIPETSRQAFDNKVDELNMRMELKAGTFTIPAGSTIEQIIDILNG